MKNIYFIRLFNNTKNSFPLLVSRSALRQDIFTKQQENNKTEKLGSNKENSV